MESKKAKRRTSLQMRASVLRTYEENKLENKPDGSPDVESPEQAARRSQRSGGRRAGISQAATRRTMRAQRTIDAMKVRRKRSRVTEPMRDGGHARASRRRIARAS